MSLSWCRLPPAAAPRLPPQVQDPAEHAGDHARPPGVGVRQVSSSLPSPPTYHDGKLWWSSGEGIPRVTRHNVNSVTNTKPALYSLLTSGVDWAGQRVSKDTSTKNIHRLATPSQIVDIMYYGKNIYKTLLETLCHVVKMWSSMPSTVYYQTINYGYNHLIMTWN